MSLSWRKHPRVMTTSVSPAMTTKLIKLRWLTSQENPHKWSVEDLLAYNLKGGGEGAESRERLDTPTAEVYPHTPLMFYGKKEIKASNL